MIIGTHPDDVRMEADTVTTRARFRKPYYVDADHINLDTVDRFIPASDFFTIDVASYIGKKADERSIESFVKLAGKYAGDLAVKGIPGPFRITDEYISGTAEKYLFAAQKAGEIYRKIEKEKGKGKFITEVSMDEVPVPQKPSELFFILMMLGMEKIPLQTIAPKFSGRFNKGVDYVGKPGPFAMEFEEDLLVIDQAVKEFRLPSNLKMSVHSGSDKFAIYPHIGRIIRKYGKGIHLKTAGTTWLEEVIGLAMAGGEALDFVKEIYFKSLDKTYELCAPYADVIDINHSELPSKESVNSWDSNRFAASLRHVPGDPRYNPNMRQLIHVGYKLAAERMDEFYHLLDKYRQVIAECVFENIYYRHIARLFII
jgi:hypothetical protein